jgi:hypothetical protein
MFDVDFGDDLGMIRSGMGMGDDDGQGVESGGSNHVGSVGSDGGSGTGSGNVSRSKEQLQKQLQADSDAALVAAHAELASATRYQLQHTEEEGEEGDEGGSKRPAGGVGGVGEGNIECNVPPQQHQATFNSIDMEEVNDAETNAIIESIMLELALEQQQEVDRPAPLTAAEIAARIHALSAASDAEDAVSTDAGAGAGESGKDEGDGVEVPSSTTTTSSSTTGGTKASGGLVYLAAPNTALHGACVLCLDRNLHSRMLSVPMPLLASTLASVCLSNMPLGFVLTGWYFKFHQNTEALIGPKRHRWRMRMSRIHGVQCVRQTPWCSARLARVSCSVESAFVRHTEGCKGTRQLSSLMDRIQIEQMVKYSYIRWVSRMYYEFQGWQ